MSAQTFARVSETELPALLLPFSDPDKHLPSFKLPYPERQEAVQYEVQHAGCGGVVFGGIPPQFPVGVEGRTSYYDRGVADSESNIREVM